MKKVFISNFYLRTSKLAIYETYEELRVLARELHIELGETDYQTLTLNGFVNQDEYLLVQESLTDEEIEKVAIWGNDNWTVDAKTEEIFE